mmetsp:Transcript_36861/g.97610  ORF Transcript_36861/g.97610 Transcript_36861/m.97610 type:complete len:466 (+) Transcript_36861:1406-2803(+)
MFPELLSFPLPAIDVLLHVDRLRLLALHEVDLLLRTVVCLHHALVEDVALAQEVLDLLAVHVTVALHAVVFLLDRPQLLLQVGALALDLCLLDVHLVVLLLEGVEHLHQLVLLDIVLLDLVPPCAELQLPLLVVLHVLLVLRQLLLELLLQLSLLVHPVAHSLLQSLLLLLRLQDVLLDLPEAVLLLGPVPVDIGELLMAYLVLDTQVLHLPLELLLAALLLVDLIPLLLDHLLHVVDRVLRFCELRLHPLKLLEAALGDPLQHVQVHPHLLGVLLEHGLVYFELPQLRLLLGAHAGAQLYPVHEFGYLRLELCDGLLGRLLLLQGLLDQLLLGLDVAPERRDLLLVLGGGLHRILHLLRAGADLRIKVADLLRQPLLRLVRPEQGLVQLLILIAEFLRHLSLGACKLLDGVLIVLLEGLQGRGVLGFLCLSHRRGSAREASASSAEAARGAPAIRAAAWPTAGP